MSHPPDPGSSATPSRAVHLLRGLARRCPVCGQGRLFRRWFTMLPRCPRCGLRFEREPGAFIGAVGMNTIVSFVALLGVLVVAFALTYPSVPVATVLVVALATAVVLPVLLHPVSRTLWTAIDLIMRPLEPGEVHEPWGPQEPGTSGSGAHR